MSYAPRQGELVADRYRIGEQLGEGGMGVVFAARDSVLARDVAIKILHSEVAARRDARQRFMREAKVAAAFSHPKAIRIFDFGEDKGRPFLAMERLRGMDLAVKLATEGRLSIQRSVEIAYDVSDVLDAAHAKNLVHRDIKPDNVYLEDHLERVVVLDFGMAFVRDSIDPAVGRLTSEGLSGGTPAYMAPEQCGGVETTGATDVYALGCVLFESLVGAPPFSEVTTTNYFLRHLYDTPEPLCAIRSDVPKALEELVARMLAKRPDDRPAARTVRQRLAGLDVAALAARERGRDMTYLSTRAARAVPRPTPILPSFDRTPIAVRIVGEPDDNMRLGLAAVGIQADFGAMDDPGDFAAIYLRKASLEDVAHVIALAEDRPVLVGSDGGSIEQVKAFLRLGVVDVVTRPNSAAQLASKLRRVTKRKNEKREK